MKRAMLLMANALVIALVTLLSPVHAGAQTAIAPWQVEGRPYRVSLDWRGDDRKNPAEATEVFIDTAKLAAATGASDLAPESFTFISENADGTFEPMPVATRNELGQFGRQGTAFRFVPPASANKLWMYFGGTDRTAAAVSTQWNLLPDFFDSTSSWTISDSHVAMSIDNLGDGRAMQLVYDDNGHPLGAGTRAAITRTFAIPPDCRGVEAKVAFDLKATCQNYVPLSILLEQFDSAGKKLDACVVDPRWLSLCVASGEDVKLREQGFIYPATVSIRLSIRIWCAQTRDGIMNPDGSWLKYPDTDKFQVQITRAELRAAHPISFPGSEESTYAPGLTGAKDDLSLVIGQNGGFCYDGFPRAVWSEGALPSDPHDYGWPCNAGTFECWILPQWDPQDSGRRFILDALAGYGADHSVLQIYYAPATHQFHIIRADSDGHQTEQLADAPLLPGQWHHVAYTWDPAANRQELFLDGASILSHAADPISVIDITDLGSSKQLPGRVWFGQSNFVAGTDKSLHGRMDDVRISDGIRYTGPFQPQRTPFTLDQNTRALFHFDGRTTGLIANDRGYIEGTLLSPASPQSGELAYEKEGSGQTFTAQWIPKDVPDDVNPLKLFQVNFYHPLAASEFTGSSIDHRAVLHLSPGQSAAIDCKNQPRMDWVEVRCPDDGSPLLRPFVAKPGEVDARTMQSLLASLNVSSLPVGRARADAIFKFLVAHNDYFWTTVQDIRASGEVADPGEEVPVYLNGYPEFGCGEQNHMVRDCFLAAGMSADSTHGSQHVFEQVFFDGSWHIYDLFARMFFPARDGTRPAALSETERDPYLMTRVDRSVFGFWLPSDTRIYQFPDREIAEPDMGYRLRPGESFRYYWHNAARYNPLLDSETEHSKLWEDGPQSHGKPLHWANHFPPYTANGIFSFACKPREDHPALSDWHDGSFVYRFLSPFVVCGARVNVSSNAGAVPTVEISYDQGNSWASVPAPDSAGNINLDDLCIARHLYWLRVTPPAVGTVDHFEHQAIVLMNPKVLTPVLAEGNNTINFTADSGAAADVTIQYHEDDDTPLEIEGGARFGWVEGHPRQLLVSQPGGKVSFHVKQSNSNLSVIAPDGVKVASQRDDADWRVNLDIPSSLADGLYPITVKSGDRHRTVALLIAAHARLVSPEDAIKQGNATITDDPEGIRGQVLSLQAGAEADFPLGGDGSGPLALFALAKIPQSPETHATLALPSGPAPFIDPNYAHQYWVQDNLLYQWKWYHVRAGGYPWPTLAAVNLADPNSAAINCTEGQALIGDLLVLPARDESLVEEITHYLFSGNYDPWEFDRAWGPVVTGVPYPLKK